MHRLTKGGLGLVLVAGMVAWPNLASGASPRFGLKANYRYRTVKFSGEANSDVSGRNAAGEYTGVACDSTCTKVKMFVASRRRKRTFFTLPFKNYSPAAGPFSEDVAGIDNAGDVVGLYLDSKGSAHGFERLASGRLIEINDPQATDAKGSGTVVGGISFGGSVIVGYYLDSTGAPQGFLLRAGKFTTYDVPGAAATEVNFYNYGEFGGTYVSSTGADFGFYVTAGQLHTVTGPGESQPTAGNGTELVAVSSDKTLFGDVLSTTGPTVGFADAAGSLATISDPEEVGVTPLDGTTVLNASPDGDPVGSYSYTAGTATQPGLFYGFIAKAASP